MRERLAIVTGASSGIGYELAAICALRTAIASVTPAGILAEQHRKMAEPGSGKSTSKR